MLIKIKHLIIYLFAFAACFCCFSCQESVFFNKKINTPLIVPNSKLVPYYPPIYYPESGINNYNYRREDNDQYYQPLRNYNDNLDSNSDRVSY